METNRREFLTGVGASTLAAGNLVAQPKSDKPLRIAIIGTGHRAWAHLAILKAMPNYQVAALADPTPENLDQAATLAPGAKTYRDYKTLLAEQKDIDAVVVITPSFLHADPTVAAFERGLPVLCEKPMATSVEDANRMIAASRKAGKPLYIGFQKRLVPVTKKMKDLIAEGAIGKVEMVSGNLFRGDWNPKSWKYTNPKTGVATNWRYLTHTEGSALLEDGVHEIDSLHWMINDKVVRVMAAGGNNLFKDRETADHVATIVEYASGVKLSFELCLFGSSAGPQSRRMVLIGSEGVMFPENGKVAIRKGKNVRLVDVKDDTPKAVLENAVGSAMDNETYKQYQLFAQTVLKGQAPLVDPEAAKATMKLILLAEKAWREHRVLGWNDLPA
jgi:predicted dehydrogenase